ncbi:MAG: VOC family protein [Candidatus Wallbacteria bacterium]|nr:VOC family protein [Candidatus Wallbacteria bacterium]
MTRNDIRLEHAFLTVRSLEQTLDFYRQLFPSWIVRWQGNGSRGGRWLHFGAPGSDQPSYLSFYEDAEAAAPDEAYTSARVQHIGFAHPDVAGLMHCLTQAGIAPLQEPIDDGKYLRSYYADPDGHELEFVQQI